MAVAENLQLDYGVFFLYAALAGLFGTLVGGLGYGRFLDWQDRKNHHEYAFEDIEDFEKKAKHRLPIEKVPGFGVAVSILMVPIMLILLGSFGPMILPEGGTIIKILNFIGDKNIAMLIGVIYAALVSLPYLQKPVGCDERCRWPGGPGASHYRLLAVPLKDASVNGNRADYIAHIAVAISYPVLVLCLSLPRFCAALRDQQELR